MIARNTAKYAEIARKMRELPIEKHGSSYEWEELVQKLCDSGDSELRGIGIRELGELNISGYGFGTVSSQNLTTDMTDHIRAYKALQESNDRYKRLLESITSYNYTVYMQNGCHLCTYHGPGCINITGYTPDEFESNPKLWHEMIHEDDRSRVLDMVILISDGGAAAFVEHRIYQKGGTIRWVKNSMVPRYDEYGIQNGYDGCVSDISLRKHAEETMVQANEELEQKIIDRTRSLEKANNRLKHFATKLLKARKKANSANRMKSEFLANMSHEIRNPLSAIIGFSELALRDKLGAPKQDHIQKIHNAGKILLNIINDILDFSKIEAGKLEMEHAPFALEHLLENVTMVVRQKAHEKNLELLVDISPEIETCLIGDQHRLGQIVTNLLSNAIKFTEKGFVKLTAQTLERREERLKLLFSVQDSGIGLSEKQTKLLFQPFTQADGSTSRKYGGTGLGLSISKQLVEMLDGNIWCESEPGSGSTFSFTAWFDIGGESAVISGGDGGHSADTLVPDYSDSKILLVEDNEINRHLVTELLKDTGIRIDCADNGETALQALSGGDVNYDLIFMDIQMPIMDGYEATRVIRSDARFDALPIVAMTAHVMREEREKIKRAGMNDYISKPFNVRQIIAILDRYLNRPVEASTIVAVAESARQTTIPALENLDCTKAIERLDGDKALYFSVLKMFLDGHADADEIITKALNGHETKSALRMIHTVIGNAGSIGAYKLYDSARLLEKAIQETSSGGDIDSSLKEFSTELKRVIQDLKSVSFSELQCAAVKL